jgi:hypothetical protein
MNGVSARSGRVGAPVTPLWAALPLLAVGVPLYWAAGKGGNWPLITTAFISFVAIFFLVLRYPHVGISIFLTTFMINYPGFARGAGALTINNILGMAFMGLLAWDYYVHRDTWYLGERLFQLLLVLAAWFLVGTVAAEYTLPDSFVQRVIVKPVGAVYAKTDYTERYLFQFFSRVAFALFILKFVRSPRQLRWVFLTFLACIFVAVPPSLTGYLQGTSADFRALTKAVNWADNANRFAFGLLVGVAFLLHLAQVARSLSARVACLLGAAVLLPLVLLSASRSGFMGLFLLGALLAGGAFGRTGSGVRLTGFGPFLGFVGVAVLTYVFVLTPQAQERVLNINPFADEQLEGSASTEFREATLRNSIELIKQHPVFGVGIGNFRWMHKYAFGRYKPPHNSYVWSLAEGGVPLLLLYMTLFAVLWRRLGRLRAHYATDPDLPLFPHWLRVYLVLFLFFSFFADVWIEEHIFLLAAATILLGRWSAQGQVPGTAAAPSGPWSRPRFGTASVSCPSASSISSIT